MEQNLEHYLGDTLSLLLTMTDDLGVAINITGYTFYFTIKDSTSDADASALLQKNVTSLLAPLSGQVLISATATEMAAIPVGTYFYDVKYKQSTGEVYTALNGTFAVVNAVTKRAV